MKFIFAGKVFLNFCRLNFNFVVLFSLFFIKKDLKIFFLKYKKFPSLDGDILEICRQSNTPNLHHTHTHMYKGKCKQIYETKIDKFISDGEVMIFSRQFFATIKGV
jgi:hypothetical protein